MRPRRIVPALITLGMLASSGLAAASSHPIDRTEEYVAGFVGDTDGICAEDTPANINIGVVCLSIPNRAAASIRIDDASLLPVGGYYVFMNGSGDAIGSAVSFCGRTTRSAFVPNGAAKLVVYIGGPAAGPLACLVDTDGGWVGVGTNGTVTATFSG